MNDAYLEAKRQLAFDPPTHMSPGEWRRLVEGLVALIEQERAGREDYATLPDDHPAWT